MTDSNDNLTDDPLMLEIARLQFQKPRKDTDYYLITIFGNENGTIEKGISSHWVGYTDTRPAREIRTASLMGFNDYDGTTRLLPQAYSVVNDTKDLYIYLLIGGYAFMEQVLAQKYFPNLTQPNIVVQSFSKGYIQEKSLPKNKKNHAPTKKIRMNVLKRDHFRCRVCGRSPDNYVDLELHVHHILPWGKGGITEEENMITLCDTCHDGLEPHFEPMLFEKLGITHLQELIEADRRYAERMKLYMAIVRNTYFEEK